MSEDVRKAEARGDATAEVKFRDEVFTIPVVYDDFTVEFVEAMEDGRVIGMVRGALGPRQWRTVKAMGLTTKELAPLADDIAAAMGFSDAGNSTASSD